MGSSAANTPANGPHLRASDAERDEAVDHLREQFVAGRLSQDTFSHRMESALSARARSELPPLLADLPPARLPARLPAWRPAWRQALDRVQAAVSDMRRVRTGFFRRTSGGADSAPLFFPPDSSRTAFTIGREASCDLLVADMTVSRSHARLTRTADGWLLADLGSTNGTTVNGWRVREPVAVRLGDRVRFGTAQFVFSRTQQAGDPVAPGA